MSRLPTLAAAAAALALVLPASSADAYWWNGAYSNGIGGLYRSLDFPTELRVPYFASRPPVYYSAPVPRTYGYSPFAYPPTTRTPELAQPIEVVNPFVPSSSKPETRKKPITRQPSTKNRTIGSGVRSRAVGPKTILNPFVSQVGSGTI